MPDKETKKEVKEAVKPDVAEITTADPVKYAELKEVIEKYKEQNPVKYEIKKEVLEAQLSALK